MVTVSGFLKIDDAMEYYRAFSTKEVIRNPSGTKIISFIIGRTNFEAFTKDKNPGRYLLFFKEKYLNEETNK
jgi:hypothetical protein